MTAPQLASGWGKFHSDGGKNPQPLSGIALDDIRGLLAAPPAVAKDEARWCIFSTLHTRSKVEQLSAGQFCALWQDFDEGNPPLVDLATRVGWYLPGVEALIYTSRSATEVQQKARVIVPIWPPVGGADFQRLQAILNDKAQAVGLAPDRKTESCNQVAYLPNKGVFYGSQVQAGQVLNPLVAFADELAAKRVEEAQAAVTREARKADALAKMAQRLATGKGSAIEAYNAAFDLPTALEAFGYVQQGGRYLSPLSGSGSPGVSITPDGTRWMSSHGSDLEAGIGRTSEDGKCCIGDAFDLYKYYDHGNDQAAAVKAAGEALGVGWNDKPRLSVDAIQAAFAPAGAVSSPAPAVPVPLLPELEPAAPYPLEALPPRMREAVEAIADHVKAPFALAGQCVIGAAAYLAQARVNAPHVNRPEGMPCSLFLLTLADSGDRKSECRRLAFKTVDEAEGKARTQHRQACDEITSHGAGLKGKALEEFSAANPLPADPRTQYSDATFERIAGDMIRGASAASWDTDEGGQVLGGASLKADTRAATLGGLVKAFDNGAFERTRSHGNAEGSGFAYNRRLSVHLLAQAVTVGAALRDPLLLGQGFLPRFLFASPASLAGTRFLTTGQLNRKAYADPRLQRYWARCEEISSTAQAIDPETGEVKPPVLELRAEAEAVWLDFYNEVEGEQSALGAFANLRPFAGRAGEIARRLAAVFACFEGLAQIDSDCMRRAVGVVRYSLAEWARYTDSEAANPERQQAAALLEWLKEKQWHNFEARKLQKNGPKSVRQAAKNRDRLLAVLVEHRQLLTTDGKQFTIHPLATTATSATTPAP